MVARGVTELRGRTEQVAGQQGRRRRIHYTVNQHLIFSGRNLPSSQKPAGVEDVFFFFLTIQVYEIAAQSR